MNSVRKLSERVARKIVGRWIDQKKFSGSVFDRFKGLEYVLPRCSGSTILDVGACEGLVAYEFARKGAKLVHGFEREKSKVVFARRLFRDVPLESKFIETDLARKGAKFDTTYKDTLLDRYDIVLFLGVYHHLVNQMPMDQLTEFVRILMEKSGRWFVVRSNALSSFEDFILSHGFKIVHTAPAFEHVGLLKVYERIP